MLNDCISQCEVEYAEHNHGSDSVPFFLSTIFKWCFHNTRCLISSGLYNSNLSPY